LLGVLLSGCNRLITINGNGVGNDNGRTITPSDEMITDERQVDEFTGIDMRTFGRVFITQGETNSVVLDGSDNLVPLVKTEVRNGMLVIVMEERINIIPNNLQDYLTFKITVRDLNDLVVGGLALVEMEALSTNSLDISKSGAGQIQIEDLAADRVDIDLSGLGNVDISGEVAHATIGLSGAGEIQAANLRCASADVSIPGLGSATVWVTDSLTGQISGGGSVGYFGDPATDTQTTGLGSFRSLGNK
jgi:hypothetical protein